MSGYILAITRGHNGGACLLKDGEIVFAIEEERLSRNKYDGGPFASIIKTLEYTDTIDYLVIAHTQDLKSTAGKIDYSGDDVYTGLCRKLGLLRTRPDDQIQRVIDLSYIHHKLHAACAFYRSGFDDATAVIIDGAGTFAPLQSAHFGIGPNGEPNVITTFEVESIIECKYPSHFMNVHKHHGVRDPIRCATDSLSVPLDYSNEAMENFTITLSDRAGIVKCYEAITEYCGFSAIEAGKTMGLAPYGKFDEGLSDPMFKEYEGSLLSDRNMIAPAYPQTGYFNMMLYDGYRFSEAPDLSQLNNRKNAAWKVQEETQKAAAWYIRKSYELTGNKNVVISGGYGLNCVANYSYLEELKDLDLNIYVEPVSSDAGTAIGAALMFWHYIADSFEKTVDQTLYLGPNYNLNINDIKTEFESDPSLTFKENVEYNEIIDIITDKNVVAVFQGKSESGPRALGNRSLLFDPTFEDGKDFVNTIKKREYFRPFAGSILEEDVHDWFDLRGMESSPHMMYAVNCKDGVEEKIPSIIHVDGTCRIQTVNAEQNEHYYNLIKAFKDKTGIPILFNTSFNLGGEPLVETLNDAIRTLQNSEIEYLYLPEIKALITVENPNILDSL